MIHHITKLVIPKAGLSLFVFGDLQKGNKGFKDEAWQEFKHQFKRCPGNKVALGLGDYGDFLRPSIRPGLVASLGKDDSARSMMDSAILKKHDEIINAMSFLDRHMIGLHEGHHTWYLASGGNLDQRLASALHAPYLGWTASTRLVMTREGYKDGQGGSFVYTIVSSHGNSNGAKVGAAVNWMQDKLVPSFIADQYCMGHGCKNANFTPQMRKVVRRVGNPGVDNQLPRCLIVGGFSEGYTNGWDSDYIERAGMVPQPIGWGMIRFNVTFIRGKSLARGVAARAASLVVEQLNVTPVFQDP